MKHNVFHLAIVSLNSQMWHFKILPSDSYQTLFTAKGASLPQLSFNHVFFSSLLESQLHGLQISEPPQNTVTFHIVTHRQHL